MKKFRVFSSFFISFIVVTSFCLASCSPVPRFRRMRDSSVGVNSGGYNAASGQNSGGYNSASGQSSGGYNSASGQSSGGGYNAGAQPTLTSTSYGYGPEYGSDAMEMSTNRIKIGGQDGDTLDGAIEKIGNALTVSGQNDGEKWKTLARKEVELSVAVSQFYVDGLDTGKTRDLAVSRNGGTDLPVLTGYPRDEDNAEYKAAKEMLTWFMQGTVPEGKTGPHPDILAANIVHPLTNQPATNFVEATFFAERKKYESLANKPVQIRAIWSGITAKDQVNKFVETQNLKSPRETLSDGSEFVYMTLGHTILGRYFDFREGVPCHTSPCDLNTMLSTRPNVDGTRSFTVANVCRQIGYPCQIVSHGSHNYENYDATFDEKHLPLDASDAKWFDHHDRKISPKGWSTASRLYIEAGKYSMDAVIADGKKPVLHLITEIRAPEDVEQVKALIKKKFAFKTEIPAFWNSIDRQEFILEVYSNNNKVAQTYQEACAELNPPIILTAKQNPGIPLPESAV